MAGYMDPRLGSGSHMAYVLQGQQTRRKGAAWPRSVSFQTLSRGGNHIWLYWAGS